MGRWWFEKRLRQPNRKANKSVEFIWTIPDNFGIAHQTIPHHVQTISCIFIILPSDVINKIYNNFSGSPTPTRNELLNFKINFPPSAVYVNENEKSYFRLWVMNARIGSLGKEFFNTFPRLFTFRSKTFDWWLMLETCGYLVRVFSNKKAIFPRACSVKFRSNAHEFLMFAISRWCDGDGPWRFFPQS